MCVRRVCKCAFCSCMRGVACVQVCFLQLHAWCSVCVCEHVHVCAVWVSCALCAGTTWAEHTTHTKCGFGGRGTHQGSVCECAHSLMSHAIIHHHRHGTACGSKSRGCCLEPLHGRIIGNPNTTPACPAKNACVVPKAGIPRVQHDSLELENLPVGRNNVSGWHNHAPVFV